MRQIGDDLRSDPREAIVTSIVEQADLSEPANFNTFKQFSWNKFAEMSHKYCGGRSFNLSSGNISDMEQTRFKTCLAKYS